MRIGHALVLGTLLLAACGADEGGGGPCTAGAMLPCRCDDGGDGLRWCEADGAFGACSCNLYACDLRVTPAALTFGTVCLEGSAESSFELANVGAAPCHVTLALEGEEQQHFAVPPGPVVIGVGERREAPVAYHPTAAAGATPGAWYEARVRISVPEEPSLELPLSGGVADVPAQPILSLTCGTGVRACNNPDRDPFEPCCSAVDQTGNNAPPYYGRSFLVAVDFGTVFAGGEQVIPIQVENLGCGPLELSTLALEAEDGTGLCPGSAVRVATPLPVTVPGAASVQARQHATVELRFAPTEPCDHRGGATLRTNDPDIAEWDSTTARWGRFGLLGSGAE